MSEDLLRKVQLLEEDYVYQPVVAQQVDLREINQIRSQLGMPLVDARLNEIVDTAVGEDVAEVESEPEEVQDHAEAREIYQAYLKKIEELEVHSAYADQVAEATAGQPSLSLSCDSCVTYPLSKDFRRSCARSLNPHDYPVGTASGKSNLRPFLAIDVAKLAQSFKQALWPVGMKRKCG